MRDIKSRLPGELEIELIELGEPKYKAKQVFKWLSRGVHSFDEMSDLSKATREKLSSVYYISSAELVIKQEALDGTVKYLWRLADGNAVESVVMRYEHGNSICISTQLGCRMGCKFCASTGAGLIRNLEVSEMLDQIICSERDSKLRISNIVLMGIGEPLDNFDNVLRFLRLVNEADGLNIGMRHISLSTCGLAEGIDKLASHNLQLTLSVSLHAPDDETRSELMPINRSYDTDRLFKACRDYYAKTGRRISFEYAVIDGVNNSKKHASMLASKMKQLHGHVNLIALNDIDGGTLKPGNAAAFAALLREQGVNVTIRRRLGADIEAACGQLRRRDGKEK